MSNSARPTITVITPVYDEAENLAAYTKAVEEILFADTTCDFRVLFVEDGSRDEGWKLIEKICAADARYSGLRLSRNFGAHKALSAGLAYAGGDAVCILAADLQDPPSVILEFVEKWRGGAQIVWGHRKSRRDSTWRVLASKSFFSLIRRHAMPRGSRFTTGSFLLMDRLVLDCYRQFPEHNRITFALVAWTGFSQEVVEYDRAKRLAGQSKWSFRAMLSAMYDTFMGFSNLPARLMTWAGVLISLGAVAFSSYLVLNWLGGDTLPGWTGVMFGLSVFAGVQFLMMGIVGEYLYRIYTEAAGRPLYFISDRAGDVPEAAPSPGPPAGGGAE